MTKSHFKEGRWINQFQKFWITFGLLSLFLRVILPANIIENYYTRGIFPWIRSFLDIIHNGLPIHWFWILIIGLFLLIIRYLFGLYTSKISPSLKILRMTVGLAAVLLGLVGLFLWLWGFNYGRNNFYKQIGLQPVDISLEEMEQRYFNQIAVLKEWRAQANTTNGIANPSRAPDELYQKHLVDLLQEMQLASPGRPVLKDLRPSGFLMRLGTSGFYNPISGEANLDPGLHPLQIPFVSAHELAHAYGITDEGACNFLAVLVGRRITNPSQRYAFELTFYKYLRSQYSRMDRKQYELAKVNLPAEILHDLQAIRKNGDLYPDVFPKLRDRTYEFYLKSQGIAEGLGSYNKVVNMVAAWEKKKME